jgi:hypothetical protein
MCRSATVRRLRLLGPPFRAKWNHGLRRRPNSEKYTPIAGVCGRGRDGGFWPIAEMAVARVGGRFLGCCGRRPSSGTHANCRSRLESIDVLPCGRVWVALRVSIGWFDFGDKIDWIAVGVEPAKELHRVTTVTA